MKNFEEYVRALTRTNQFLFELNYLADSLTDNAIKDLGEHIRFFASTIINNIDKAFLSDDVKERMISKINLMLAIDECLECINIIGKYSEKNKDEYFNNLKKLSERIKAA